MNSKIDSVTAGNFSFTEKITVKYAGAAAMYFVSKNLKKKYNIMDERAALYEAAETWVNALDGRDFLGMQFNVAMYMHFVLQKGFQPLSPVLINQMVVLGY